MTKTIYTKIMTREITSVELNSVLGRELYICNNGNWTDVLDEFGFTYTSEQFYQYIADLVAWAEHNNTWLEIQEGKAKYRKAINSAKGMLKVFFDEYDYSFFPEFYKTLSKKEKRAVKLVLSHSELLDYGCTPLLCPSTSELSLLWKKFKKRKTVLVPVKGTDYDLLVNIITGEVVAYTDYTEI